MSAFSEFTTLNARRAMPKASASGVEPTGWGYVIPGAGKSRRVGFLGRALCGLLATSLFIAVLGLWIVPGANYDADVLPFKLACSGFFLLFGCFLLQFGGDLGRAEIHVDTSRQELRMFHRTQDGNGILTKVIKFADVHDVKMGQGSFLRIIGHNRLELAAIQTAPDFSPNGALKFH